MSGTRAHPRSAASSSCRRPVPVAASRGWASWGRRCRALRLPPEAGSPVSEAAVSVVEDAPLAAPVPDQVHRIPIHHRLSPELLLPTEDHDRLILSQADDNGLVHPRGLLGEN